MQFIRLFKNFRKADVQLLGKLDEDKRYLEELIKNPILKKNYDMIGDNPTSNIVKKRVNNEYDIWIFFRYQ